MAWNSDLTGYKAPGTTPTLVPSTAASAYFARTICVGCRRGMNVTAVSVLSVLAGAKRPCAFFAASTSPVSRSASTYDDARTAGGAVMPGTRLVTTPGRASSSPPTTGRASADAAVGKPVVHASAPTALTAAIVHSK